MQEIMQRLGLCEEEALELVEEALTVAQVWFAELEDATMAKDFDRMRHAAHQIAVEAQRLQLYEIIRQTEEIELLTTFRRAADYRPLLEALHQRLYRLFETFRALQQESLSR